MNVTRHSGWLHLLVIIACFCTGSTPAATNYVTNTNDNGPGSLRDAIRITPAGGSIWFAITGTVLLASGEININRSMCIRGPGGDNLSISGNGASRVFRIAPLSIVELAALHITGGATANGTNGVQPGESGQSAPSGGGILNEGVLTTRECLFSANTTGNGGNGFVGPHGRGGRGGDGGAILNLNQLVVTNCVFIDNHTGTGGAGGRGTNAGFVPDGAAPNAGSGADGGRGGFGTAIFNSGTSLVLSCTFSNNTAGTGGIGGAAGNMGYTGGGGGGGPGAGGTNGFGGNGGSSTVWNEQGLIEVRECLFSDNHGGIGGRQDIPGYSIYPNISALSSSGSGGDGGAIGNRGTALILRCTFRRNAGGTGGPGTGGSIRPSNGGPGGKGGAIANWNTLRVSFCSFFGNTAGSGGLGGQAYTSSIGISYGFGGKGGVAGAVYTTNGEVMITDTEFDRNSSGPGGLSGLLTSWGPFGDGGALVTMGNTTITNSSFTHNNQSSTGSDYGKGGAIVNEGALTLSSCTISSNVCGGYGGGIYSYGPLTTVSCTIVSNRSRSYGGGIFAFGGASLRNSIVARNYGISGDLYGSFKSESYNWLSSADEITLGVDIISTNDPMLGPLVRTKAGTLCHVPLRGSPLIDTGDDSLGGTDQRGFPRRSGPRVDIGAIEFQVPSVLSVSSIATVTGGGIRITCSDAGDARIAVLGSSDVTAPESWLPLGYLTNGGGSVSSFVDLSIFPRRFYQLRME